MLSERSTTLFYSIEEAAACARAVSEPGDVLLLARLLGAGSGYRRAMACSQSLLQHFGSIQGVAQASGVELARVSGIGPRRAEAIQAALELGRRATGQRPTLGQRLASSSEVWAHMQARLSHLRAEEFWMLALDVRSRLLLEVCVARGCLTGVEVHPREVFRTLIRISAASVIFCHNHPSGDPTPSDADIQLTFRLREVGQLCGITVVDHVVVGHQGFVSLAERGWL